MTFDIGRHRLQFNIDCNVWMYKYRPTSAFYRPYGQPLTAEDIQHYVDILADSGIDVLTVNAHAGQLAYYPSKTVPTILDGYTRGERSFFFGHILGWDMTPAQIDNYLKDATHYMDAYVDLVEAGIDWVEETAKACRRRGIVPWISIRMNDMHGASKLMELSYMNCELFKNPEMRLRGTGYNPQAPAENGDMGMNYAKPEVREHVMAAIRDMVENYDYEGLQLEWNRSPLCCEPGAGQATIDTITQWHADVRAVTQAQGEKIGKHYALGVKHVGTLNQMRSIGIDLRAMAQQNIIDFTSPTNFWQSSWDIPCDEMKQELGGDVAVYGAIEIAPNWLQGLLPEQPKGNTALGLPLAVNYRLTPFSPPTLWGNAAAKLAAGADGIEVYNFACADQPSHWIWEDDPGHAQYSALPNLADLETLRGRAKFYSLSSATGYYVHQPFETVAPFPGVLGPQERRTCRIPMCAETNDELEFVVQLVVEKREELPPLGIYFNEAWPTFDSARDQKLLFAVATMTHHAPDKVGLNFSLPLSAIQEGWNEIVVMNGAAADFSGAVGKDAVTVYSVEVAVRNRV